jgi:hypothetical protein
MSNIRSVARQELVTNSNDNKVTNLVELFDLALQNDDAVKTSTIRAITQADLACPLTPTCAGLIDASFSCANGIENYIKVISSDCCPVSVSIFNKTPMAVALPSNRVFGDQSNDLKGAVCVTLNPQWIYSRYLIDNLICENACGGGKGVGGLLGLAQTYITKAILNGVRKKIYDTAFSGASAVIPTTTGDLADRLIELYSKVTDNAICDGKKVVVMANRSVINRLMLLRDANGNFIYNDRKECPITGCLSICFYGIQVVEMDKTIMPNNTTTNTAEMVALCVDNIFVAKSTSSVYTKSWDTCLNDTFDVILAKACVDAVCPPAFAGSSARTTVNLNWA